MFDTDHDGRSDGEELQQAPTTDPLIEDSDLDGYSDGVEVEYGTNAKSDGSAARLEVGGRLGWTGAVTSLSS